MILSIKYRFFALGALFLLVTTGCTVKPLVAPGEPSAIVSDSSVRQSASTANYFYLAKVDETAVQENHVGQAKPTFVPWSRDPREGASRAVPAGPQLLTIVGAQLRMGGINNPFTKPPVVGGVIEAELIPGQSYRVTGVLEAFRREVWLENTATQERVGRKIQLGKDTRSKEINQAGVLYTCCNLRYEEDWISDANWVGLPFIPAGARIATGEFGKYRAYVNIEGRVFRIGLDYGREQDSIKSYLLKITTGENPQAKFESYPASVVAAIAQGRIMLDMTKEQVMISLGYPRADETTGFEANEWVYRTYDDTEFILIWNETGRLKEVDATRSVRQQVMVKE